MLKIKKVFPKSIAKEIGISVGDRLLAINGNIINDEIDFQFYFDDEVLDLEIEGRGGETEIWRIDKEPDEIFGVEFEPIKYRTCQNQCIFCFVDQMPPGLRSALYFKDDDFRLSFLYGNYLTLTNITEKDFIRIKNQRLSPLYISVHTTAPNLRRKMCRHKKAGNILEQLKRLAELNIELHIQIVLCPNINDGEVLRRTISDLADLYPAVQSVAIVPVGLSKWRKNLYPLEAITGGYARRLIAEMEKLQAKFRQNLGMSFIYLADEFYLKAETDFPQKKYYDGYNQLEDGVGMTRLFLDMFDEAQKKFPVKLSQTKKITMITSTLSSAFMADITARLNQIKNLDVKLSIAKNRLFGESITVTGLLCGNDILSTLKNSDLGDLVVLPPNVLNGDGLFLDDMTVSEMEKIVNTEICVPNYDLQKLYEKIF